MVPPGKPSSTTGQWWRMKRASEVPPVVEIVVGASSARLTASATSETKSPGLVMNTTAPSLKRSSTAQPVCAATVSDSPWIQAFRPSGVCASLKRMLNWARASAGMTLPAGLPTSTVVKERLEGSKCSVPSSRTCDDSRVTSAAMAGIGLRAFFG